MKKATTINELANNLLPNRVLTMEQDSEAYVPVFDDKLKKLRSRVLHDEMDAQTFYIAGQSGSGKSTALNFFRNNDITKNFIPKYIDGNAHFDMNDIDVIDVLLMLGFALASDISELKKYEEELQQIVRNKQGMYEQITEKTEGESLEKGRNLKASAAINFLSLMAGGDFFNNFRVEKGYKRITRQVFAFNKNDLFNKINEMISLYEEKLEKKLLLIINDFDHLKDIDQINSIFVENRYFLENLRCKKILSIPIHLTIEDAFTENHEYFGLKLHENPLGLSVPGKNQEEIKTNRERLEKIVFSRISEGADLIDREAVTEAITLSGGVIRQLIDILYNAAVTVRTLDGTKVTKTDVSKAADEVGTILEKKAISREKIELLEEIRTKHSPTMHNQKLFFQALLGNQVLSYTNKPTWYEVNPLENTVKIYAKKLNEQPD